MPEGLTRRQRALKRLLDLLVAVPLAVLTAPVVALAVLAATVDTRRWGVFAQERVGRGGRLFRLRKVRTMRASGGERTTITVRHDARITRLGAALRAAKIDELPQLWNVVAGEMSLVGPRPDVPGYADLLRGADRVVLAVRPGITGPAALAYRHEEALLARADDPVRYNDTVLWPDKVRINRAYVETYTLGADLRFLAATVGAVARPEEVATR